MNSKISGQIEGAILEMGTHAETSTLKTLADAVTETAAAEEAAEGSVGSEGLDVNAAFDGGGDVVATETVVRSGTEVVGPGGPDSDSGEPKGNGASPTFEGEEGAKECGPSNGGESGLEQRSNLDKTELGDGDGDGNGSFSSEVQMDDNYEERKRKTDDLYEDGRECTMEMDEGNVDSYEVEYMEDHRYSVGDLVWGKIKSHPWWPGQIYDPSHASESAMKYNQKDRLLVAYFGDGSFAWCLPSQLIPFAQYFEDMSKQSTSKTFVNAVQEAVDEIGRLVELEMTCPCIPEEHRNGLGRAQAVNAGVKAGILVPDGEIGKLLSFRYDPVELLAAVGNAAESLSFPSMLDFSILKAWLSAFYRERGGYVLPVYCGPLQIEGLEDKDRNEAEDANDFSVPIEVPIHRPLEEDSFSSAASVPANGQAPQEDKNHHRRKQKSVAELMAEGSSGGKHIIRKRINHGEGTNASNSVTKKQKLIVEVENHIGSSVAVPPPGRKRGRKKKDDNSQSGESAAPDSLNGFQTEEEMQESKLEKERITVPDTNDGEGGGVKGGGPEEISSPRERKKSKYLSPPYTTPIVKAGNFSLKKEELESEEPSERKSNRARMGERMTKAAGKVLESSSGMKNCNDNNTVEKEQLVKGETGDDENSNSSTDGKKAVGTIDVSCSVNGLLSGVQSFAVNPGCSRNSGSEDMISGFLLAFRKSMYAKEEESCKDDDKKKRVGVKRKSLNSEPEKLGEAGKGDKKTSSSSMQEKSDAEGTNKQKKNKIQKEGGGGGKQVEEHNKEGGDEKSCPDNGVLIASKSGVGEISDLDSVRETLKNMTSMLEKCDDKRISTEAISKVNGDIKLLFEKVKKIAEAAAN